MADGRGRELDALAVELSERGYRAERNGGSLLVAPAGCTGPERVIASDGDRYRWGCPGGRVLGPVGDVDGAASRAVSVLSASVQGFVR